MINAAVVLRIEKVFVERMRVIFEVQFITVLDAINTCSVLCP